MTQKLVLGIDPGLSGALALFGEFGPTDIIDVPTHEITVNGKKRRRFDMYSLARWLDLHSPEIERVVIEDVHALPAQGVSSTFAFGRAFGTLEGLIAANFMPVQYVSPAMWKRALGLTADKDASRRKASQLWPSASAMWALKKHDGRAEAALIAYYGTRTQQ